MEVWHVELERDKALVERLCVLLTDEERARAARLKRPGRAERWIVTRAALRILLGARLGRIPEEVRIAVAEHGKPYLADSTLRFNLSHSGERALIAIAAHAEVGIDVERPGRNTAAVERTLSDGERASGHGLLQMWCRKEALAKAMGGGLGWAPEDFDTTQPGHYALADIPLDGGYVGALAAEGRRADFDLYTFSFSGSQTRIGSPPRLPDSA